MPTETANASNSLEDIAPYQNCAIGKLLSVTPVSQATTGTLPCRSTSLSCKTHALPRCLIRKTLLGLLRVLSGVPTCAHNSHPLTACSLLVCRKVTTPMWAQLCRPGCIRTFLLSLQRMAIHSFQALTHLTGILSSLSMAAAAL